MILKFNLTLLFLLSINIGFSQELTYFTVANTTTQLINREVNCVHIDQQGNKWFGTKGGLSKYDGTQWTNYTSENTSNGLNYNFIVSIASEANGTIWVATAYQGVLKFDGTTWTNYSPSTYFEYGTVDQIVVDSQNNKWFVGPTAAVKYDDTNWTKYDATNGLFSGSIHAIAEDIDGTYWFTTVSGVFHFDGTNWTQFSNQNLSNIFINNDIYSVAIDAQGTKWFGHQGGLIKYDNTTWSVISVNNGIGCPSVKKITIDAQNNKWLIFESGSIVKKFTELNSENFTLSLDTLGIFITNLSIDNQAVKWFSTTFGVKRFDEVSLINFNPTGLTEDNVRGIAIDHQNNKWFVTDGGGVCMYDGTNWNNYNVDNTNNLLIDNYLLNVIVDSQNNKWFIGGSGVSRFDGTTWTSFSFQEAVSGIIEDHVGNIWVGQFGGVGKYDGITWTTYPINTGFTWDYVNSMAVDLLGNIWIGFYHGIVAKYDGINWTIYPPLADFLDYSISTIAVDQNNSIWFGSVPALIKNEGGGWTTVINDGLNSINDQIIDITVDAQNTKWILTYGKLKKLNDPAVISDEILLSISGGFGKIAIDLQGNKWIVGRDIIEISDNGPGPFMLENKCIGMVFNDLNGNGIRESQENGISEQIIQIDDNYTASSDNGLFCSYVSTNSHTLHYQAPLHWELTTPESIDVNIPNNGDTVYFGIKAIDNIHDLRVNIVGGPSRVNFEANSWITYTNIGTLTENGTLVLDLDDRVSYVSANPAPTSVNGGLLSWDFTNLIINEHSQIRVTTQMPDIEYLGDTLQTSVSILPIVGENNQLDNVDTLHQILTGSYDPNDKTVHQGVLDENYVLFDQTLDYTIRFQNTGTDTAFNVNVYDTISSSMDMSTLKLLGTSHPCQMEVRGTNLVVFHFYDILLPDSTTNQLGSNGFIQYSISPKDSLDENTVVNNTGYIYFDYNPAIITNTAFNTYVSVIPSVVGIIEKIQKGGISIYPNPTQGNITIDLGQNQDNVQIKITDFHGRKIKQLSSFNSQFVNVDLGESVEGVYFITVKSEEKESTFKIIKQ